MPKLDEARIAERKRLLEDAALRLFTRLGFNGVGLREVAQAAGVSLGNLYNYYPSKEAIFESVLGRLHAEFAAADSPMSGYLARARFPDDLEDLGRAVGEAVRAHQDYLTLVYVDIAEFRGRHVRAHYAGLAARFRRLLGERLGRRNGRGVDPAVAFAVVYMQFFNYFIVERMIGARGHLGLSDGDAVRAMSTIYREGLRGLLAPARRGRR